MEREEIPANFGAQPVPGGLLLRRGRAPYPALAQYVAGVLGPVETRVTEEGIIVLRLF